MADIIPPGYAECVLPFRHTSLARDALVTFGVSLDDAASVTMANAIEAAFTAQWDNTIDSNVLMGPLTMRVGQDGGENLVIVGSSTHPGLAVRTDSINPSNAVLVQKRTSRGGRRGRGRMYVPWAAADSDVDEAGRLTSGQLSALQAIADATLTAVNAVANVGSMVLLHSEGESAAGSPNEITSLGIDVVIGVQRRRLGR